MHKAAVGLSIALGILAILAGAGIYGSPLEGMSLGENIERGQRVTLGTYALRGPSFRIEHRCDVERTAHRTIDLYLNDEKVHSTVDNGLVEIVTRAEVVSRIAKMIEEGAAR